ncbi:DUF6968 family protein [Leptospira interrogans]|uniref:DUF6968 domain-containing protein n=1 Tax=Leptospira interrogans str. FPW1039 TaxID=1193040 RepID=A0A0F6I8G3_LEPIR|nr:hypothetical protein [Leptospira interrogans]ASV09867.1 hypothetical protein B2G50_17960 [Leptospira interrogans serovar Canicola]EKO67727.1 hypothetical protein LEP1GSC069_1271 [Leptospira interrogans serovar Canicola str. Fiocruz LV133]EKR27000.1 hypothetical protein LEP1GSC087_2651 [Leptospira interrogans serovar Bataviae str. L1111]EKR36767.1 hypothetical protein LEP1GSC096_2750 [Leptospira interrogans serovar Hebdomadis str. R499]EKR84959.1 hypothetical protein LEP1GSC099_0496 [Leptosp
MIEKQFKLGTVIVERELFFQSKNKKQKIIVKIGKPKYLQKPDDCWYCPIQITGIGSQKIRAVYGVDSMQSLQLAIKMIIIDLSHFQKTQLGKLTWLGQERKVISKIFLVSNATL